MSRTCFGAAAIAAALAIAAAGPSWAQPAATAGPGPEVQTALNTYYTCARASARRLEASQEAAEAIARAARVFCMRETEAVEQVFMNLNPALAGVNLDRAQTWGDTLATAEVVVMRLCRLAKDCRSF